MSDLVVERCPARAAVAGNPSDGYGGAVVAVPVRSAAATVTASPAADISVHQEGLDTLRVAGLDAISECTPTQRHEHRLVLATLAEFHDRWHTDDGVELRIETTIPRSVGLAGSSAIVIATMRALFRVHHRPLPHIDVMASIARSVEADRIGIPAGLQDRVVQTHDRPMMMRFGPNETRNVGGMTAGTYDDVPVEPNFWLFVAARPDTAASSEIAHGDLRARMERGDADVSSGMRRLAEHAERASDALTTGDRAALGAAMDGSFRERLAMMPLDHAHVEMIDAAQAARASANYSGSGGAVVVSAPDADAAENAAAALDALGCVMLPVQL